MRPLQVDNCLTLRELKDWLAQLPDKDPDTGEDLEVWMMTGQCLSSPVNAVWPLNCDGRFGDICFHTAQYDQQHDMLTVSDGREKINDKTEARPPKCGRPTGSDFYVYFDFGDDWPTACTSIYGVPVHAARFIRQAFEAGKSLCTLTMREKESRAARQPSAEHKE